MSVRKKLAIELEVAMLELVPLALRKQLLETVLQFIDGLPLAAEQDRAGRYDAMYQALKRFQCGQLAPSDKARVADLNPEMSAIYLAVESQWRKEEK